MKVYVVEAVEDGAALSYHYPVCATETEEEAIRAVDLVNQVEDTIGIYHELDTEEFKERGFRFLVSPILNKWHPEYYEAKLCEAGSAITGEGYIVYAFTPQEAVQRVEEMEKFRKENDTICITKRE